jgi:hypothetical protein
VSLLAVLFGASLVSQLLPLLLVGNIRQYMMGMPGQELWSGLSALYVSAGLILASFLAVLFAVMVGQRNEGRRMARRAFFAIAALGAPWGGAQLVMSGLLPALATFILVAGSLEAGRLLRRSSPVRNP